MTSCFRKQTLSRLVSGFVVAAAVLTVFMNRSAVAASNELQSVPRDSAGSIQSILPDTDKPQRMGNPAELQRCLAACRAGGTVLDNYCYSLPTPQFQALCFAAAALGEVSCHGFCYARFVD